MSSPISETRSPSGAEEEKPKDDTLVRRYLEGDVDAFEQLVHRYERAVSSYCLNVLGRHRRELAADITQEVFLRVVERVHSYEPRGTFAGWLFTIARHCCMDAVRHAAPTSASWRTTETTPAHVGDGPDAALRLRQLTERLDHALQTELSPRQCQVFALHRAGMRYSAIAKVLEISTGTVKYHVFEARERLRHHLAEFLEEDTP
ncbi:MAG: sigma-70 family RNA polymerase sigma factor [Myxococcota bacterium]